MYFILLVYTSKLDEVYVHFMIAGHTKFSCDSMFGTIAPILQRNILKNLSNIANLITSKMINSGVYVGKVLKASKCLNYKDHFGIKCSTIKGITKYHHFRIYKMGGSVQVAVKIYEKDNWQNISTNFNLTTTSNIKAKPIKVQELDSSMMNGFHSSIRYNHIFNGNSNSHNLFFISYS